MTISTTQHPCFNPAYHKTRGRMHLPVAPRCNIDCNYCGRTYCAHESRPGVAATLLAPGEVADRVERHVTRDPRITVIGVAGPGEPLFNEETFESLEAVHASFPSLSLCVSTNGLLLPDRIGDLQRLGVRHLTVTINTVDAETGGRINPSAWYQGKRYTGRDAAELLLRNQLVGLKLAVLRGLIVKVNCVYIPELNGEGIVDVARAASSSGAALFNIMPLIPQNRFSGLRPPSAAEVNALRDACAPIIPQMRHCRQCRADASGILGEPGFHDDAHRAPAPWGSLSEK